MNVWRFLGDESGAGMVEYALVIACVAMAGFAALRTLGQRTMNRQDTSANALPG